MTSEAKKLDTGTRTEINSKNQLIQILDRTYPFLTAQGGIFQELLTDEQQAVMTTYEDGSVSIIDSGSNWHLSYSLRDSSERKLSLWVKIQSGNRMQASFSIDWENLNGNHFISVTFPSLATSEAFPYNPGEGLFQVDELKRFTHNTYVPFVQV